MQFSIASASDEEETASSHGRTYSAAHGMLIPLPCGGANSSRSAASTSQVRGTASGMTLGLNFRGAASSPAALSWRDGRFSDWTVKLGDSVYNLHGFILARASSFFESHMSMHARQQSDGTSTGFRGSDLTTVLPVSCYCAFEDALDFIYSENQAGFEAPPAKALLLLKIANILMISGLFNAMHKSIQESFEEMAPLLLEQYCRFHIPGTDDGDALGEIREHAVELVVKKLQPFLAIQTMRNALLQLPPDMLADILARDELRVACEDTVFDFVVMRLREASSRANMPACSSSSSNCDAPPASPALPPPPPPPVASEPGCSSAQSSGAAASASSGDAGSLGIMSGNTNLIDSCAVLALPETAADEEVLWLKIRWQYLSAHKFAAALNLGQRGMLPSHILAHALQSRIAQLDIGGAEAFGSVYSHVGPRSPILPDGVPPPTSMEIDFAFHVASEDQYACGDALRSQPKLIGDLVLRLLVFPCGTDTGVARGSVSVFLEAVPQRSWPRDWEFANIRYAISCVRWPTTATEAWHAKRKSDVWTFKPHRLDRGWHDFLSPGEIHRYIGPDGFVCLRGSVEPESLGRAFLLNTGAANGEPGGAGGEPAGSSASRRPWTAGGRALTMQPGS
eukprot:TRINITY_DN32001_c0_g1_i1.p1 TRINITY_DN32001_c0_g1~~TRINITY_DN32001_c0_g1_i1.p1  ORF type:complete len:624 (-),score=114.34 TRINITY_DN32001_c0_g1_i1:184-2055(-)